MTMKAGLADQSNSLLWLRAEEKSFEERTLVSPQIASQLIDAGYELVIEKSDQRIFDVAEYEAAGCAVAEEGAWRQAPAHAIILGLKELDYGKAPLAHRHIHFAHAYKNQQGWTDTLAAFDAGGGVLYDLEYLTDDEGRRIAAFGYWAGFVGAATSLLAYCGQKAGRNPSIGPLNAWADKDALIDATRSALEGVDSLPSALVIGALGRCGRGAVELFKACDVNVAPWDQQETAGGGPFKEILQYDLLVNCVFIGSRIPAFTTLDELKKPGRQLRVIADVSCDPFGDFNPLPIYNTCTTMHKPVTRLLESLDQEPALDLIAIDHLPSLLPLESTEDFASQMLPHLLSLNALDSGVWQRASCVFNQHLARMKAMTDS